MTDPNTLEIEKERTEPSARAMDACMAAMDRIKLLKLTPTPQVYEVWYRYFQGDPDIVDAVEQQTGNFSEEICNAIYKKFLSENDGSGAVRKVSDQVQSSIAELAAMLGSVRHATSEYGDTLDTARERIKKISSVDELEMVVTSIVEDTKKMVEKNQNLEIQLVNSSKQVTELRKNLDTIRKEVLTDGLTGLYNRKAFDTQIFESLAEADNLKIPLVLMLLDIDHFKKFNDSFGHQVGDQVLRLVAKTLTDNVKGRDIAARYGGEEFAIILPETPLLAGMKVGESLRKNVENKEIVNKATKENLGRITLSIGVAEYIPGESITDLIERADAALYAAKNAGRNQVMEAKQERLASA